MSGAAAMDVEQSEEEERRGRKKGKRAPDVVITLPSRITLKGAFEGGFGV